MYAKDRSSRSPVPDLIFEDVREERLADIAGLLEEPGAVDDSTPLHRLTVFVTYRCNLDCPYCKTIARSPEELARAPQKRAAHTTASFAKLLATHRGTPIRHLHFTGGEATILPHLPQMIAEARRAGVEWISITSNGTLPLQRWAQLLDAGLDEVRISIDAADAELGARLTGRRRAWSAAVSSLAQLGAERTAGRDFFLIANVVVGEHNRRHLVAIVRFLLERGADDIKLITEVQRKDDLGSFPEVDVVRGEIAALLDSVPATALPLLRRKLATVFAPDGIGTDGVARRSEGWRCYIPLSERTVDAVSYYPCSVYLREGGAPLGRLDEPIDEQRRRTAAFVQRGDCLDDPICRRYCLHCTREFNEAANRRRNGQPR